ncbi:uncharacterized protein LOC129773374 [Toxorhynchites rutilus septentrionalis]|uniref:uncharacterized protein LOC129773374 n=1 Tax=Toxorhynchites rutilus septentrionalis TaxID=329112 RepID=UPI0024795CB4|nr:uncharacterized protein LOC129773374 [Toxorhynchites rutilus septentrionalis]
MPQMTHNTSSNVTCFNDDLNVMTANSIRSTNPETISTGANVLLSTVLLMIQDGYGKEHLARALLDSGSQCNLMSEQLCQRLRLARKRTNQPIFGIGASQTQTLGSVSTNIRSRCSNFSIPLEFLVLRQITTNLPTHTIPSNEWMIPRNINLADPEFHVSKGIELILGAEHLFSFLKGGRIQIGNPSPVLVESVFGWFATGNVNANPNPVVACQTFCFSTIESIASNLEKFWQIEDIDATIPSPNEQICEQFYRETTTRDTTGRYIVKYPKKDNITKLIGESYSHALQRMEILERRLDKTPELKTNYHNFIAEFIELGHMRKVSTNETIPPVVYYLPHHPVLKDSSTTTKVRSVFYASMKTSTGYALNDALLVGPVVQHELLSLILRFRKYKVALTAEIEKMYRQISIHPDDRPLQRLLWRFNKDDPISEYELTTVTYGLSSSSFLATRTLHQLAEDEGESFTLAARALKRDFYVDDFIRGEDSIENAIKLREQMDDLLKRGGFTLRKWCSNHPEVVDGIPEENLATQSCQTFDSKEMIKTLGICWDPKSDQFQFDIDPSVNNEPITKRKILSSIACLYDPLGLIAPILVRAKILLQQLWAISLCWDEEVPLEIRKKWRRLSEELSPSYELTQPYEDQENYF